MMNSKSLVVVLVFMYGCGGTTKASHLSIPPAPGTARALYNPKNGDLFLHLGSGLSLAGFEFPNGYDATQLRAVPEPPALQNATILAFFNPTGLTPGLYNLGDILPPQQDRASIDSTVFFNYNIIGQNPSTYDVLMLEIPEPATLSLLVIGVAATVGRRRQ
jgi:hypothetical protein